jgi:hypothetical protein
VALKDQGALLGRAAALVTDGGAGVVEMAR